MDSSVSACLAFYQRLAHNDISIYVNPEYPDWFVPTSRGDRILQLMQSGGSSGDSATRHRDIGESAYAVERFFRRLPRGDLTGYTGRAAHLTLKRLRECWFHVTNRCNLSCAHCMFSSGPGRGQELTPGQLKALVGEARRLGCEVFYFTGGEPLIYPELLSVCRDILTDPKAHVVILTNGMAVEALGSEIVTLDKGRVVFQISLDGNEKSKDAIRGQGTFRRVGAAMLPAGLLGGVAGGGAGERALRRGRTEGGRGADLPAIRDES